MRIRRARLVSNLLFALSALLAWLALPPRSPMITALGLSGPSAAEARRCGPVMRLSCLGRIPTGEVMCRGRFDPARPGFFPSVFYEALSRRVLSANAAFGDLDSAAATSLADSLARALDARGGQRIGCSPLDPVVADMWRAEVWRFPGFDVRLLGYRPLPGYDAAPWPTEWRVGLIALPTDAPDCRFVRRLHN